MPKRYLRSPDGGFVPYSGGGGTGGSVTVDETLSVSGAAADAKVAGEKISKFSEAIDDKLDANKLPEAINTALAQAKASGEFDGEDGSNYVLTEADKTEIAEIAAGMVDVPDGGGSGEMELLCAVEIIEEVTKIAIDLENPGYFSELYTSASVVATSANASDGVIWLFVNEYAENTSYGGMTAIVGTNGKSGQGVSLMRAVVGDTCISVTNSRVGNSYKTYMENDTEFTRTTLLERVGFNTQNGATVMGVGTKINLYGRRVSI